MEAEGPGSPALLLVGALSVPPFSNSLKADCGQGAAQGIFPATLLSFRRLTLPELRGSAAGDR